MNIETSSKKVRIGMVEVSVMQIASVIFDHAAHGHNCDECSMLDEVDSNCENEGHWLDVRLQVFNGYMDTSCSYDRDRSWWSINVGDSSYDNDMRGDWGSASVRYGSTMEECKDTASELLDQASSSHVDHVCYLKMDNEALVFAEDIRQSFTDTMDTKEAEELAYIISNRDLDNESILQAFDTFIRGHGIESTSICRHTMVNDSCSSSHCGFDMDYVNMGDTYTTTLIYDHDSDTFSLSDWGSWMESKEAIIISDILKEAISEEVTYDRFSIAEAYYVFHKHVSHDSSKLSQVIRVKDKIKCDFRMWLNESFNASVCSMSEYSANSLGILARLINNRSIKLARKINQPLWHCVGNLGDASPLDHDALLVYVDRSGQYNPEMEKISQQCDGTYQISRVMLDPCQWDVINKPWFADNLESITLFTGSSKQDMIDMFDSSDPLVRARAYEAVADYYGYDNFDGSPLVLTRSEVKVRYAEDFRTLGIW
jgi:hypothetical protein